MLTKDQWTNSDAEKLHDLGMIVSSIMNARDAIRFSLDCASNRDMLTPEMQDKLHSALNMLISIELERVVEDRIAACHAHYLRSKRLAEIEA